MTSEEEEKAKRIEHLRSHAEQRLQQQEAAAAHTVYDLQSLIHELQVHQMELETQNEELMHSRAEIEKSRNDYSNLYEAAPIGYFMLDHYGLILRVNRMGSQLVGSSQSNLAKQNFRNLVVAEERADFYHFLNKVFETGAKQSCELQLVYPKGEALFVHLEAQVVQPVGAPTQCLLTAIDMTAKKEAENKLRQSEAALKTANEQLESLVAERTSHLEQALQILQEQTRELSRTNQQLKQVNTDLDNFIYTASHDLKAPIANIEGLLYVLLKVLPKELLQSEDVQQITTHMQDSVNRFKNTIADLTEVTKLQREEGQDISLVDMDEIFREVALDLAPVIEETAARLSVDMKACHLVGCSKKNLRSVVYNLLSNALKYHHPDRIPEVHIRCGETGEYTLLSVQDNGLGMNQEELGKIFHMFKRLHNHVEGSGLGLYMVKKIVENAGGKIEVQSQPGKGSTFTVYFRR